jgi:hypothetical protein
MSSSSRSASRILFGKTIPSWQDDPETVEKGGLSGIGLGDAAQANPTVGRGWQHDVVRLNSCELVR